ncbi:MAG: hypothetical protein JXA09_13315 [Anaerolineae bacterium]|nr:hypothetical protein [Anaerolineae bacterium]
MPDDDVLPARQYYATAPYLLRRYRATARQMGFQATDRQAHAHWQGALRARLRQIAGIDRMLSCDLDPHADERVSLDGYSRQRVTIQTEPDVVMPLYVLVPDDLAPGERRPVVIAPHGHTSGGKYAPAGRRDIAALAETIAVHN